MKCDQIRQELLRYDWDQTERQQMAECLAHLNICEECKQAFIDYDYIRSEMRGSESEKEPVGGWSALEERLTSHITTSPSRQIFIPGMLAASIVIAVIGWGLFLNTKQEVGPSFVDKYVFKGLTSQEIKDQVEVFDQVSETFEGRTGWVVLANNNSDLGLTAKPVEPVKQLLLLRLNVLCDGVVKSKADFMIVPGQTARLNMPVNHGTQINYQIATSQDTKRLQLWVEVVREGGDRETLAALATDIQPETGQVIDVGEMVTAAGRYGVRLACYQANIPRQRL